MFFWILFFLNVVFIFMWWRQCVVNDTLHQDIDTLYDSVTYLMNLQIKK